VAVEFLGGHPKPANIRGGAAKQTAVLRILRGADGVFLLVGLFEWSLTRKRPELS